MDNRDTLLARLNGPHSFGLSTEMVNLLGESRDEIAMLRQIEKIAREIDRTGCNAHALPQLLVNLRSALAELEPIDDLPDDLSRREVEAGNPR